MPGSGSLVGGTAELRHAEINPMIRIAYNHRGTEVTGANSRRTARGPTKAALHWPDSSGARRRRIRDRRMKIRRLHNPSSLPAVPSSLDRDARPECDYRVLPKTRASAQTIYSCDVEGSAYCRRNMR